MGFDNSNENKLLCVFPWPYFQDSYRMAISDLMMSFIEQNDPNLQLTKHQLCLTCGSVSNLKLTLKASRKKASENVVC